MEKQTTKAEGHAPNGIRTAKDPKRPGEKGHKPTSGARAMSDESPNDSGKPPSNEPNQPKDELFARRLEKLGEEIARNNKVIATIESELAALAQELAKPERRNEAATNSTKRATHSKAGKGRSTPARTPHLRLVGDKDHGSENGKKAKKSITRGNTPNDVGDSGRNGSN